MVLDTAIVGAGVVDPGSPGVAEMDRWAETSGMVWREEHASTFMSSAASETVGPCRALVARLLWSGLRRAELSDRVGRDRGGEAE